MANEKWIKGIQTYTKWANIQGIGAGWIAEIKSRIPIGTWIQNATIDWLAVKAIGLVNFTVIGLHIYIPIAWITWWMIFLFLAVKFYGFMVVNWFIGKIAIKSKVVEAQANINAKFEETNPFEVQRNKTLKSIAKATGAEDFITDL